MEMTLNNGFCELTADEVELIDGGGFWKAAGVFVGTVAVAWSPVVAFVCPPAAGGMALGGLGIIGKATGKY
ncbi:MAG: hypothetical protein SPL51_07640 [Lachnospiraceae bacterium]|jgi:hypothetical protein|nr:hypothetical protein [Eubacteriales bacterium]MDY6329344.1 hypothetical protein [Lachnospiraceae bacterium]